MLDLLANAYNRLRWGKVECVTAFVHPDDWDLVNDIRIASLREEGEPFKIKVASEGRLVLVNADGTGRADYGHPEPGRVIFVEERTRNIQVTIMIFERETT